MLVLRVHWLVLVALLFDDWSGIGTYLTGGTTTNINGLIGEFVFANELTPPKSILVYAANTATNEYIITHLNAGGDNTNYKIVAFTFTPFGSPSGQPNQYDSSIFTNFGGTSKISIDLAKANFDWNRIGFPTAKEAHVYIVFNF